MNATRDTSLNSQGPVCEPFVCRDGQLLPRCHDALADLAPGIYLVLFHGRDDMDASLDDWGFDGPVIGPLDYVHTTYASEVKLRFVNGQRTARYFPSTGVVTNMATGERTPCPEAELAITADMIVFDGRYFGDWTVFYRSAPV